MDSPLVQVLRWLARRASGLYNALGLVLVAGLLVSLLGVWVFAELAERAIEGQTHRADEAVLRWMQAHATPALDAAAIQVTSIGNGPVVAVIVILLGAFLWLIRDRFAVLLMVAAVGGADLMHRVLKLTHRFVRALARQLGQSR